jgi:hypothetical protein
MPNEWPRRRQAATRSGVAMVFRVGPIMRYTVMWPPCRSTASMRASNCSAVDQSSSESSTTALLVSGVG